MARVTFITQLLRVSPPWLRRAVGGAVMESLGVPIETEVDRSAEGVELRFPDSVHTEALGFIGRERRILRGPGEDPTTFAVRLRLWWDAHLIRGGPYALLGQLYAYFLASNNVPMEVVGNSGIRHKVDTAGNITRDSIVWNGDGNYPLKWARIWIFMNLAAASVDVPLLTEGGEPVLTEDGEAVLVTVSVLALSPLDEELFCAVPREWSAAHIDEVHMILLYPGAELWGYRATDDPDSGGTIGTWDEDDPSAGQVWQPTDPVDLQCV